MKHFKPLPKKSPDAKSRGTVKPALAMRLIMGRNSIAELIKREEGKKRIIKAFLQNRGGGEKGADARGAAIEDQIRRMKIPTVEVSRDELSELCGSDHHQGVAVEVKERKILDLHELTEFVRSFETGIVIALDSIQDPQNVGSILRAAECLGAKAVFWSHNRSSGITPAAAKVSAGASEIVTVAAVSNLRDALEKLKKEGFWSVAAVVSGTAENLHRFSFPEKTCLILGSEGGGVSSLVAKEADFRLYIQQYGSIDSLNVGQAAAVFMAEYARQRLDNAPLKVPQ